MAPISPGHATVRPRKPKQKTQTTKTHRFETFTNRISRLKIDPIHVVENRPQLNSDTDLSQSYFRTSLDEWAELNLSHTFTSFLIKANPLCENLPQLMYHADTIFALLVESIEKQDSLALEPLLSLVAHLAHDLGQNFEKYFAETVALVAKVAACQENADAIEWCFTCLAWIFKFLSRLLVQDLRPLLNIMKPYLYAQKDYISRFTAESLAFLLRKAASLYPKKQNPVHNAVSFLLTSEDDATDLSLQISQVGVMNLLVESALGIDGKLHSSAEYLLRTLLELETLEHSPADLRQSVLEGTIISLIHHTTNEGFQPAFRTVVEIFQNNQVTTNSQSTLSALRLLKVMIGTRKGSRILEWNTCEKIISSLWPICRASSDVLAEQSRKTILTITAMILQFAPMDQLLPSSSAILNITREIGSQEFFSYCMLVSKLGKQRFQDFLLPQLQQFIVSRWEEDEIGLSYLLSSLHGSSLITQRPNSNGYIFCGQEWARKILGQHSSRLSEKDLIVLLILSRSVHFPREDVVKQQLLDTLSMTLERALNEPVLPLDASKRLALGWAFDYCIEHNSRPQMVWTKLAALPPDHFQLASFIYSLQKFADFEKPHFDQESNQRESIQSRLVQNLVYGSQKLKESSLLLLGKLAELEDERWLQDTIEIGIEVLQTPYTPANVRQIVMLIRRFPQLQRRLGANSSLKLVIPYFCLGMLSVYFDQTRRDLCGILGQIIEDEVVEEQVLDVVLKWLQAPSLLNSRKNPNPTIKVPKPTPFQCSNLMEVEETEATSYEEISKSHDHLHNLAAREHEVEIQRVPTSSRTLALQFLKEIPGLAERKSRLLIPLFLNATKTQAIQSVQSSSDESVTSHTLSPEIEDLSWTLHERKAFLELQAKFVNPKVLYRSAEVREQLVDLLSNGNADIRRLALDALFTWKDSHLISHENMLRKIVKDEADTTEIGMILSTEEGQSSLSVSARPSILPILLRLLFGKIITRSEAQGTQESRRKSLLRSIFRMHDSEIKLFLDIVIGPLSGVHLTGIQSFEEMLTGPELISLDRQYGFLRMILSILEVMQTRFAIFGNHVVAAVLYCTLRGSRLMKKISDETSSPIPLNLVRNLRRTGLQCLNQLFQFCPMLEWDKFAAALFREVISPRLDTLAIETAQGVSVLLQLIATWASFSHLVPLTVQYDISTLPSVWRCLTIPSAKSEVKVFVIDKIATPLAELGSSDEDNQQVAVNILESQVKDMFEALAALLQNTPSKEILGSVTSVIPKLAQFVKTIDATKAALELLTTLLNDAGYKTSPLLKSSILNAIESLLKPGMTDLDDASDMKFYRVTSSLFNYFKDQPNRLTLCQVLGKLCAGDTTLEATAQICHDLNAVSRTHLDEIDYDRRLETFQNLGNVDIETGSEAQLLPILYNLLYFARDEDFSIRSNAVSNLKQIIVKACSSPNSPAEDIIRTIILPGILKGVKEDQEAIRADFVSLFGLVVQHLQNATELQDMVPLLVGNDEEASFFSNILHVQQHRRSRAIRRLISAVENGSIRARNISSFFIPLLEKFAYDVAEDESSRALKGESLAAMERLLQWVDWKNFKVTFRSYKAKLDVADRDVKDSVKLLGYAANALSNACNEKLQDVDAMDTSTQSHLAESLPSFEVVHNELKVHFLPKLTEFIHYKDETEISSRIPAAVIAVKLSKLLPEAELPLVSAPIILDISHILKSRAVEARDLARNTLCQVVELLGASSMQFVLKEMRGALTRGYQLHVLSYTVHSILVANSPHFGLGDLDYCIRDLVTIVMDDIFGIVGQEKENQDYISSMKEVKSSKSYDSMEILARSTSVSALIQLIVPLETLLVGNLNSKQARHIDELLRRIGVGLTQNPAADSRDLLIFAYQVIKNFYAIRSLPQAPTLTNDAKNRARYLIQMSAANKTTSGKTSQFLFKLAKFALDIVRSTFQRYDLLLTSENVHGFLPIIGDALLESQEDVQMSALRLLAAIIKLPMRELDENAAVYAMEAVKMVKNSTSTNDEIAQAALKLIAAVLRERKTVQIRESDISYILHRITPDLEEPDRQGVTFNFIRAVMARKFQLPEIYDIADKIGIMMVTNQTRGARDVARGVYVHFLLQYPQSSNRWSKQRKFLMKNLEYEYPEGRTSIMEAINTLLLKLGGSMVQQMISTFFVPIVLRMANDEHGACREAAGALLGQCFLKADSENIKMMMELLRSWIEQTENPTLAKLSMQAFGIYLENVESVPDTEIIYLRGCISSILNNPTLAVDEDWETQYQALQLFTRLTSSHPGLTITKAQISIWKSVQNMMSHSHPWMQTSAVILINTFFQDCLSADLTKVPLTGAHTLQFSTEDLLVVLKKSVHIIKRAQGHEELHRQVIQNLLFLSRCVELNKLKLPLKTSDTAENDDLEDENDLQSNISDEDDFENARTRTIPAIQYILDQSSRILRREPARQISVALQPKKSALTLLMGTIPHLGSDSLNQTMVQSILLPLQHMTDPNTIRPRSSDPTFSSNYKELIEGAHEVMSLLQQKLGDSEYVKAMTEVSKKARERREERKVKRRIDKVLDPERAAKEKRRRGDKKKERKKEISRTFQDRRRNGI